MARILKIAIFFPQGLPPLVVDLVRRLLKREPSHRLPLDQVLRQELRQALGRSRDMSTAWNQSGKALNLRCIAVQAMKVRVGDGCWSFQASLGSLQSRGAPF